MVVVFAVISTPWSLIGKIARVMGILWTYTFLFFPIMTIMTTLEREKERWVTIDQREQKRKIIRIERRKRRKKKGKEAKT
jgi:hypothetical protein